jgi:hypothetical protein
LLKHLVLNFVASFAQEKSPPKLSKPNAVTSIDPPYMIEETSPGWCFGDSLFHPMSSIKVQTLMHATFDDEYESESSQF